MIYVLILVFGTGSAYGGTASVVAEFNSLQACQAAYNVMNGVGDRSTMFKGGGCFAKGEPKP